jgi:hypothetical protein
MDGTTADGAQDARNPIRSSQIHNGYHNGNANATANAKFPSYSIFTVPLIPAWRARRNKVR